MRLFHLLMATAIVLVPTLSASDPKRGVIRSEPKTVEHAARVLTEPKVIISIGELARLSASPDGTTDGVAYLWMVPAGLNHKTDSNQRDVYVSAAEKGTYTVTVLLARNGEKRPELWKTEIIVQVGETKPTEPSRPDDDLSAAKAMYAELIENIRKLEIDPAIRRPLARAYTTLATRIGDGTLKDVEAIRRDVASQLNSAELTTAAGQKAILAVSSTVTNSVKDADSLQPAQYKLLFLAIAEAISR